MKHAAPTSPSRPALSLRRIAAASLLAVASLTAHGQIDPKASQFYEDALQRYEKKDYAGAVIQLKNALKIDTRNISVQVLLGKALLANGDLIAAEVSFEEALRLGVNRAEVVIPLAQALSGQGKPQPLLDPTKFAEAGLPTEVKAHLLVLKANAASDLGDAKGALKFIEASRALDPTRVDSWLAEVPMRLRALQIKEAIASADKAISLAPDSPEPQYLRGTVAHLTGDTKAALGFYDRAIKLRPTHTEALVSRAGLLMDLGKVPEAALDVAELRKSSPKDPRGAYIAALIAEAQSKPAEAKAALNDVTALLDPVPMDFFRFRPQLLMLGGLSHYGLGQREKAKPYLEMAVRSQPASPVGKVLAQIHLADKNIDRAIESLDQYLKYHPRDVQATHLLASAHMSQGRHQRAAALMQAALAKQDRPELRSMLGLSLIGSGRYANAVTELEAAIKRDPGQVQAGSALTSLYMQSGQPAKAVRVAEGLVKTRPDAPGLHNQLGMARAMTGDIAGAKASYDQALKLDPDFTAPLVNLARLETNAKAYAVAEARLNAVINREPRNLEALMEMGRVQQRLGKLQDAQRWLEKADDHAGMDNLYPALTLVDFHLANAQPKLALEAVKRLSNKAPEAIPTLLAVARVALANGDPASAKSQLSRAATTANYDTPQLVEIALLQTRANDLKGASYTLDKALQERPDFLPAMALMSEVSLKMGDAANAEKFAKQVLAAQPKRGVGHALLGDVAQSRQQRPAALEAYRRAHQLDQSTDSAVRLFTALASGGDAAAANQLAEQWLKQHPRDRAIRRALADSQVRTGNPAAARASYEALLANSPDDAEAMNNLAHVLLLLNDPAQARKMADQALARKPNAPHIIGTAGWMAFKTGQDDRALQLLRDARLRDPNNPETRYYLGAVLASKGRRGEARDELESALKTRLQFPSLKEAEKLLVTLK